MRFRDRLKFVFSNSYAEWFKAFVNGDDDGQGMPYNCDREVALKYSAIFGCSRVLSETLACLPAFTYRKQEDGSKKEANDIALYDILHNEPNPEMAPFNFKESMMMNLCLGGNGYAQKIKNQSSAPELLALYPIDYEKVTCERDKDTKRLIYKVKNGGSEEKIMDRDEIFHIPGISMSGITGIIPIAYAADAIRLGLTYEAFGVNFYKNGALTNLAVWHPTGMSPTAFEKFKDQFDKRSAGISNINKPFYFEKGLEVKELSMKLSDAQLIESKYFQIEEVCRFYRVPQHLVQMLNKSTNNNIEHQGLEFVIYTMLPWAKRWEENINLQLLPRSERKAGYFAEFKFDSLLRGDAASRATAYATGRTGGWLSVNDIRRLENMNGIGPAGDIYLQPLNFIEAGKVTALDQTKIMAEQIYKTITGGEKNA
jgi:HK97 family phage portal protein